MDHVICVIFYIYIGFYVPCLFPFYSHFRIHSFLSYQTFVEQMLGISDLHYIWFIKNDQFFKNDIAPSLRGKKSTRHTCSAQVYQDGDSDTLLLLLLSEFKYYWGHFEAPNWSWKRKQLAFSSTFVFAWAKHTHHVKPLTVRNSSLQKSRRIWPCSVSSWRVQLEDNSLQSCSISWFDRKFSVFGNYSLEIWLCCSLLIFSFLVRLGSLSVILSVVCFTY